MKDGISRASSPDPQKIYRDTVMCALESEKHGNTAVSNQSERAPKRSGRFSY